MANARLAADCLLHSTVDLRSGQGRWSFHRAFESPLWCGSAGPARPPRTGRGTSRVSVVQGGALLGSANAASASQQGTASPQRPERGLRILGAAPHEARPDGNRLPGPILGWDRSCGTVTFGSHTTVSCPNAA